MMKIRKYYGLDSRYLLSDNLQAKISDSLKYLSTKCSSDYEIQSDGDGHSQFSKILMRLEKSPAGKKAIVDKNFKVDLDNINCKGDVGKCFPFAKTCDGGALGKEILDLSSTYWLGEQYAGPRHTAHLCGSDVKLEPIKSVRFRKNEGFSRYYKGDQQGDYLSRIEYTLICSCKKCIPILMLDEMCKIDHKFKGTVSGTLYNDSMTKSLEVVYTNFNDSDLMQPTIYYHVRDISIYVRLGQSGLGLHELRYFLDKIGFN